MTTNDNNNDPQFLGTWFEVAMATTNPYVLRWHVSAPISRVEVENRDGQLKATVTGVMSVRDTRHLSCLSRFP